MEQLIIQYPVQIWIILIIIKYILEITNHLFYKDLIQLDYKIEKYYIKSILKNLGWIGYGIIYLAAFKAALNQRVTIDEYFGFAGGLICFVFGLILNAFMALAFYFIYRKKMVKTKISIRSSYIRSSFEIFGYSIIMLLSYLICKHPFLLGGSIGFAAQGLAGISISKKYKEKVADGSPFGE